MRDEHAEWLQFRGDLPQLIQSQCGRVDNAADAAIEAVAQVIRAKATLLKKDVHDSCSESDVSLVLQTQIQLLEHLTKAAGSDPCNHDLSVDTIDCLLKAAKRIPHPPPDNTGIMYPAISEVTSFSNLMFIGRVLGGLGDKQVYPPFHNHFNAISECSACECCCRPKLSVASVAKQAFTRRRATAMKSSWHCTLQPMTNV